jgi:hypothetical protein
VQDLRIVRIKLICDFAVLECFLVAVGSHEGRGSIGPISCILRVDFDGCIRFQQWALLDTSARCDSNEPLVYSPIAFSYSFALKNLFPVALKVSGSIVGFTTAGELVGIRCGGGLGPTSSCLLGPVVPLTLFVLVFVRDSGGCWLDGGGLLG